MGATIRSTTGVANDFLALFHFLLGAFRIRLANRAC